MNYWLLLEADAHLADTFNCQSPPMHVYTCVGEWMIVCAYTQNTQQAGIPKKTRSDPIWLQVNLSLPEEMIEGAVMNYFSACNLQCSIPPFP